MFNIVQFEEETVISEQLQNINFEIEEIDYDIPVPPFLGGGQLLKLKRKPEISTILVISQSNILF